MQSAVGAFLRNLPVGVTASVYMDDISLSAANAALLDKEFAMLRQTLTASNFAMNPAKVRTPSAAMDVFNCDLEHQRTSVREDRRDEFYSEPRGGLSIAAFERYCESVEQGNGR